MKNKIKNCLSRIKILFACLVLFIVLGGIKTALAETVYGDLIIQSGEAVTLVDSLTVTGNLEIQNSGSLILNGFSLSVNGDVLITGTLDASIGTPTITVGGNWDSSGGIFSYKQSGVDSGSTVVLTGSCNTLNTPINTTGTLWGKSRFYNLTIANTGRIISGTQTNPPDQHLSVANDLTITGTLVLNSNAGVGYAGNLIINEGAVLSGKGSFYRFTDDYSPHLENNGDILLEGDFVYMVAGGSTDAPITVTDYPYANLNIISESAGGTGELGCFDEDCSDEILQVGKNLVVRGYLNGESVRLNTDNVDMEVGQSVYIGSGSAIGYLIAASGNNSVGGCVRIADNGSSIDYGGSTWTVECPSPLVNPDSYTGHPNKTFPLIAGDIHYSVINVVRPDNPDLESIIWKNRRLRIIKENYSLLIVNPEGRVSLEEMTEAQKEASILEELGFLKEQNSNLVILPYSSLADSMSEEKKLKDICDKPYLYSPDEYRVDTASWGNYTKSEAQKRIIRLASYNSPPDTTSPDYDQDDPYNPSYDPYGDGLEIDDFIYKASMISDGKIDADGDGKPDDLNTLDNNWLNGLKAVVQGIRLKNPDAIIIANGASESNLPGLIQHFYHYTDGNNIQHRMLDGLLREDYLKGIIGDNNSYLKSIEDSTYYEYSPANNRKMVDNYLKDILTWTDQDATRYFLLIERANGSDDLYREFYTYFAAMANAHITGHAINSDDSSLLPEVYKEKLGVPLDGMHKNDINNDGNFDYWMRTFDNGVLYLNPYPEDVTFDHDGSPITLTPYTGTFESTCMTSYYRDFDGDGYGDPVSEVRDCPHNGLPPIGYAVNAGDCDDANSAFKPGVAETCGDGIDNNCDGVIDESSSCPVVFTWTGEVSTDWSNENNWEEGIVPSFYYQDVIIPYSITNQYPVLDINRKIKSLTIESGGILNVVNGKYLTVTGNIAINGTLTVNGNLAIEVNDSSSHIIKTGTINGTGSVLWRVAKNSIHAPVTAMDYGSLLVYVFNWSGAGTTATAVLGPSGAVFKSKSLFLQSVTVDNGEIILDNSYFNIPVALTNGVIIGGSWDWNPDCNPATLKAGSAVYTLGGGVGFANTITPSTLEAQNSTWFVKTNWNKAVNSRFYAGTSTVTLNGTNQTILGSNTFYDLTKTVSSAATLTFDNTAVQTVTHSLILKGAIGQLLLLRSNATGQQYDLKAQSGTQSLEYLDVQDSNATGGQQLDCLNCINRYNNTNWAFVSDSDSDGDGYGDADETCDDDPAKTEPGACGCGVVDTDSDGDGTADCIDTDDDGDGYSDIRENICGTNPLDAGSTPVTCSITVTWDGSESTNWSDLNNWDLGIVPNQGDSIIIPDVDNTVAFDPTLDQYRTMKTLTINSGGLLDLSGSNLTVTNDLIINTGGSLTLNGKDLTVNGNVTINGTLNASIGTPMITVAGNWNSSASATAFNYGQSTVKLTGTGKTVNPYSIGTFGGTRFYNIIVEGGVSALPSFMVGHDLTIGNDQTSSSYLTVPSTKCLKLGRTGNLTIRTEGKLTVNGSFWKETSDDSNNISNGGHIINNGIIDGSGYFFWRILNKIDGTLSTNAPVTATTYYVPVYIGSPELFPYVGIPRGVLGPVGAVFTTNKYIGLFDTYDTGTTKLDNSVNNIPINSTGNMFVVGKTTTNPTTFITGSATYTVPTMIIKAGSTLVDGYTDVNGNILTPGHSLWNVTGNWQNSGTFTYGESTVKLTGTDQSLIGSTTFYNLEKTTASARTLTFEAATTQTITHSLTLKGVNNNLLSLRSSASPTQFNLNLGANGSQSLEYLDVKDSNASGGVLLRCLDCTDSVNNLNWDFDTLTISTCTELQNIQNNLSADYALMQDIDCSDTVNWNGGSGFDPIGNGGTEFTGTLDGRGYEIRNLYINMPGANYVGLFGKTNGAEIKNVNLTNINIVGYNQAAGLVGQSSNSIIDNSSTSGNMNGYSYVGGLVGYNYLSYITNSYSISDVSGDGLYIGGLAGYNYDSSIVNSYATGGIDGYSYVGGLAGYTYMDSIITSSYSTGNVIGLGGSYIGGLVGKHYSDNNIVNSYSTGDVSADGNNVLIGGLAGELDGSIVDSYAIGNVSGSGSNANIGGLVGKNNVGSIINSYSMGNVSGNLSLVGGLVGFSRYGTITNSYSAGSISGSGSYIGGLVGSNSSVVYSSYWNTETTGQSDGCFGDTTCYGGASGKTTTEMKQQATFSNWDFTNNWTINEGTSYPCHKWYVDGGGSCSAP